MLFHSRFLLLFFFSTCHGNECNNKSDGHYVDQSTCHGYISCENYTTHYSQCLPGLVWNNVELYCTLGVCVQEKKGLRSCKVRKSIPDDCYQETVIAESFYRSKIQCVAFCVQTAKCKMVRWKRGLSKCTLYDSNCAVNSITSQTEGNYIYVNI